MGGSVPHFPQVLEANPLSLHFQNPHFPRIFKIPTLLEFSKSSLSSHFQNPHFPHFSKSSLFILTKVDLRNIGLPDFWLYMTPSNNEHFISQIPRFLQLDLRI